MQNMHALCYRRKRPVHYAIWGRKIIVRLSRCCWLFMKLRKRLPTHEYVLVTAMVEVKVIEGDPYAFSRLAIEFVVTGNVVGVHAGICWREKDTMLHLATQNDLPTQLVLCRPAHHVLSYKKLYS